MKEQINNLIQSEVAKAQNFLSESKIFENKASYTAWCAQTYHYVSHSCRLLQKAGDESQHTKIKQMFLEHVEEEMGHENLAKVDYRKLTGESVDAFPEFSATKKFWSSMDSMIDDNAVSMLGYAFALEFLAVGLGSQIMEQASVHDVKCIHFIKEHYELDQEHTAHLIDFLDDLDAEDLDVVYKATKNSFELYNSILSECVNYGELKQAV